MKILGYLLVALFIIGCDDETEQRRQRPQQIVNPGTIFRGLLTGSERVRFTDNSTLTFAVSGEMTLQTPQGVYLGTAFPAGVTFSVRTVYGETLTGAVSFPRLAIGNQAGFSGFVSAGTVVSSIAGVFQPITDVTAVDVQAFSYALPITEGIRSRTLFMQAPQMSVTTFEPAP
jgi:hypothetical protein